MRGRRGKWPVALLFCLKLPFTKQVGTYSEVTVLFFWNQRVLSKVFGVIGVNPALKQNIFYVQSQYLAHPSRQRQRSAGPCCACWLFFAIGWLFTIAFLSEVVRQGTAIFSFDDPAVKENLLVQAGGARNVAELRLC